MNHKSYRMLSQPESPKNYLSEREIYHDKTVYD